MATPRPAIELVALLASAGGLDCLSTVLRDVPPSLPAAIVVQQHLGGHSSVLPTILAARTPHRCAWVLDGQLVSPGRVLVCPPGVQLELTPDGSCRLRRPPGQHRFDVLLHSLARAYGPRCLAAVLSGTGRDGADGTVAMRESGAVVLAQSPNTAEFASMPIAAARAGADLVPLHRIGRVVADIVNGAPPGGATVSSTVGRTGIMSAAALPGSPAARADAAGARAAELRHRREDLASGRGATQLTVALARVRAEESRRRAVQADRAARRSAARETD
jgi:two-component system, chemotaxis family, protein-glutamate methylesterase/glutaminase